MTALAGNQEDGVSFRVVFNSAAAQCIENWSLGKPVLASILANAVDDELKTRGSRLRENGSTVEVHPFEKGSEGILSFVAVFNQEAAELLEDGSVFRGLPVEDYLKAVVGGYLDDRSPAWGVLGCAVQSVERVPPVGSCGAFSM